MDKKELIEKLTDVAIGHCPNVKGTNLKSHPWRELEAVKVDAIIEAINDAGFAIVPREATANMIKLGKEEVDIDYLNGTEQIDVAYAYKAMIEAGEVK